MRPCLKLKREKSRLYYSFRNDGELKSFSLIEMLSVIVVLAILTLLAISYLHNAREQALLTRAEVELHNFAIALELYADDHGGYPADVSRGMPSGLEEYLPHGLLPPAPWSGSVFDWDNWTDPATGLPIYQVSIRFCPAGVSDISKCHFPDQPWAKNFKVDSSVYYCVVGHCTAHISHINDNPPYPSYCVNCGH